MDFVHLKQGKPGHYVAQASFELMVILLSQPLERCDNKHKLSCLAFFLFFLFLCDD